MRPRFVIAVLLVGGFLSGVMLLFGPGSGQRDAVPPAFSLSESDRGRAEAHAVDRGVPALAGALDATQAATGANPAEAEGSAEARQRAYVETRVAELMELASQDDPVSLEMILSELTNRDPEIRKAALNATLQARNREAIPRLIEAAEQTDDPRERAAIADAIDFLRLPTLGEVMDQMGDRATNGPSPEAGATRSR